MPTQATSQRKALSLVEVLVALAILTFSGAIVFGHMLDAGRHSKMIEMAARRDLAAYQRLQETLAAPYAALDGWQGSSEPRPIPGVEGIVAVVRVEKKGDGLLLVRVTAGAGSAAEGFIDRFGPQVTLEGSKSP